ncbi:uncharacterized protein LOC116294262 [Actinia tenebrosa]|uniref:Uncharacterized protein LOC116294262 n=1 Tax=Actinia tenebrosa TaxID=6105 RepID=A0A6P8HQ01_ACTTE|nr:uncharacterized protein LOC116294262 [Actinia tenebrosa]
MSRIRESEAKFITPYTALLAENDDCPRPKELSEAKWKELEQKSLQEQKEFLDKYLKKGMFEEELVSSEDKNVRKGDHLLYQGGSGGLYDHHLLCTEVDGDNIIHVIEYGGPSCGFSASSQSVVSSNIVAFGAIRKGNLTYEFLVKEKRAKIRKWPKELQRFSVDDVISRAKSRKNERDYHAFNNNCEHFVTWCKCGLNTSLQVEPWYKRAWDIVKAVGGAMECLKTYGISEGVPALLRIVGNVSDEIVGAISSPLSPIGFGVGGVIEASFAVYYIYQDHKKTKQERLSESQFEINTVTTGSKAAGHIAGATIGSVIGTTFGVVGSLVGGGIGYGVGHVTGSAIGWCYEYASKIKHSKFTSGSGEECV